MIYLILGMIFVSWIFWALVKEPLSRLIKIKVCAICASVSGTWILLWIAKFLFNYTVDKLILAVLMGQSVAGLMYTYEKFAKEKNLGSKFLLLRILIITLGALLVYLAVKYIY